MTRRRLKLRFVDPPPAPIYTGPESLAGFLFKEYAGCDSERLGAVLLDRDGRVIGTEHILNPELDDRWYTPRLLAAVVGDACTMVPFSYKPSRFAEGDPRDVKLVLTMTKWLRQFGLKLHDHLMLFGDGHWRSYGAAGHVDGVCNSSEGKEP